MIGQKEGRRKMTYLNCDICCVSSLIMVLGSNNVRFLKTPPTKVAWVDWCRMGGASKLVVISMP